jgi:uncharacterized spore protein YtfJ
MDLDELIGNARDAITVRRVYGEPYEKDGVAIIPAAAVRGGIRGRASERSAQPGRTSGAFGMHARPVGVYVLKDGAVRWRPVVDVQALVRAVVLGLMVSGLALASLLRRRR